MFGFVADTVENVFRLYILLTGHFAIQASEKQERRNFTQGHRQSLPRQKCQVGRVTIYLYFKGHKVRYLAIARMHAIANTQYTCTCSSGGKLLLEDRLAFAFGILVLLLLQFLILRHPHLVATHFDQLGSMWPILKYVSRCHTRTPSFWPFSSP